MTDSLRSEMINRLKDEPTSYFKYYLQLLSKYGSKKDIYQEGHNEIKNVIRQRASRGQYKYMIYCEMNPELKISPFINSVHPVCNDMIRLRLGTHIIEIELGRWTRTKRADRLCSNCNVLGDERHALYECSLIVRDDITLSNTLSEIWANKDIMKLFVQLKSVKLL